MQDERDSGSDMEDEGNEQHSGSENGSVGHHSEVLRELYLDKVYSSLSSFLLLFKVAFSLNRDIRVYSVPLKGSIGQNFISIKKRWIISISMLARVLGWVFFVGLFVFFLIVMIAHTVLDLN